MRTVNILEAKSSLSRLVKAIEAGEEKEIIIIAKNGKPAARLVPIQASPVAQRIGIARGKFDVPEKLDVHTHEVPGLFLCKA